MKTVNELNQECVNLEVLLIQLGESTDFLTIKKFESVRAYIPANGIATEVEISNFYYGHIQVLYNMYLNRIKDRNERVIGKCEDIKYKYYHKHRGEDR